MKKYIKEIIILLLQILLFYVFPLFAGPTDVIGMVLLMIIFTFVLSLVFGCIFKGKIKYFYPFIVSLIFLPSIFIYYNSSALVHSLWYLVVSLIGLTIGVIIDKFVNSK